MSHSVPSFTHANDTQCMRYASWFQTKTGKVAQNILHTLVHELLAGWPRRGRSILVLEAGGSGVVQLLWDAGFEVTAQESIMQEYDILQHNKLLGTTYTLSSPEHLPYSNQHFDYSIVIGGLGFWRHPAVALQEVKRVTERGCIVLFPNLYSLFAADCKLHSGNTGYMLLPNSWRSPFAVRKLLRPIFGQQLQCKSALHLPKICWGNKWLKNIAGGIYSLPTGAFAGYRVDIKPVQIGANLALQKAKPLVSTNGFRA